MSNGTSVTRARFRRCAAATVPVALVLAFPLSANAVDPGVNYDPGSPAGKEYAIPLVQGRAEGAGTANQRAAANTPFGAGIKPPGGGGTGGGHHHGGGTGAKGSTSSGGAGGTGSGVSPALRSRIAHAEEPGGTGDWTLGIALAVLLSSALFAVVLRGRRAQPLG